MVDAPDQGGTPKGQAGAPGARPAKPKPAMPEAPKADPLVEPPVVIKDKRKVDPVSGQPRVAQASDEALTDALEGEVIAAAELIAAREEVAARTEDLQRLSAEYANYRKRVDRDRSLAGLAGQAEVLTSVIPVLDDIEAARTAQELDGPFGAVATKLEAALAKFGLERYGAEGQPFDPKIHEALLHQTSPDVDGPTIFMVLQPGYRMGEQLLRAARVGVADAETEQQGD